MSIKVGITGGIGSGKSTVARFFASCGIPVYDSDRQARRLMRDDASLRNSLLRILGDDIYTAEGELKREVVAERIFTVPSLAEQVNRCVHPCVREDFRRWVTTQTDAKAVMMESALLYEAGMQNEFDIVVEVYAPEPLRLERAMRREGSDAGEILRRMKRQTDEEEKRKRADFVVINDGLEPLIPQLLKLRDELLDDRTERVMI